MNKTNNEENPINVELKVKAAEKLQKSVAEDLKVKDVNIEDFIETIKKEDTKNTQKEEL